MAIDQDKLEAFVGRFTSDLPATLHAATGVIEKWLNAQARQRGLRVRAGSGRYPPTPEQAACLADDAGPALLDAGPAVLAGDMAAATSAKDEERLRTAFSGGGALGRHEHHGVLYAGTARFFRPRYAARVTHWIPALDGVENLLRTGARVADIGSGCGGTTILLAQAYPASTFSGFDHHPESVEAARRAAAEAGVSDRVTFEVALADNFPGGGYDLACIFNGLHETGDPVRVARHVRDALAPEGTLLVVEPHAGEEALRRVASEAGFSRARRATRTPFDLVLEARA